MGKDKEYMYESKPLMDSEGKLRPHEITILDFEERRVMDDIYQSLQDRKAKSEIKKDKNGNSIELRIISNEDGSILHFIDLKEFDNIVNGVMKVKEIIKITEEAQKVSKEKWN